MPFLLLFCRGYHVWSCRIDRYIDFLIGGGVGSGLGRDVVGLLRLGTLAVEELRFLVLTRFESSLQ